MQAKANSEKLQIVPIAFIGQCDDMIDPLLLFIIAAFLLAGFVKGVIGLGLPTVSAGLLAIAMPPAHAIAIVIVPAIVTNIWQTFVGPYLRDIVRRLWPLMAGTAAGAWLNAGMLTGQYARYGTIFLGALLIIYAALGLRRIMFTVAPRHEKWVGGIVGLLTGMISAATGVQVIPSMPFMQAIGMEKDELVQALGVFFTVATVALGPHSHKRRLTRSIDSTARRGSAGVFLHRHGRGSGGALADGAGDLPALVFDRDDLSRHLSCRQRDLQADGQLRKVQPNSGVPGTKASNAAQNCAR